MKKLKYLSGFILFATTYLSFTQKGWFTFTPLLVAFILVPILELFFKPFNSNLSKSKKEIYKKDWYFSTILYILVPIQLIILGWFLKIIQQPTTTFELVGRITSMGILCGIIGINVGHELGHRTNRLEQFLGEILLLTSLETHFLPYHNRGHHYNVATNKDPATARKNEWLYIFWFRSQVGSYIQAWQLEVTKVKKLNKPFFSFANRMVWYSLAQISLLIGIYFIFGLFPLIAFITAAAIGILLLETVNYIEHYGLIRKTKENGKLERVMPKHSWNSNHIIGRTLLFELSRHSDHHYKASKHYQLLDTLPNSPQMPTGYPGMMLLSLIPPLWFKIIHKKLEKFEKNSIN